MSNNPATTQDSRYADTPPIAADAAAATAAATSTWPPAGFVGRDEAMRRFGVAGNRWKTWERQGRLTCGRMVQIPGRSVREKLYPVEELARHVEALQREPFPPIGFVDRNGAARMFGVATLTWKQWVIQGKVRGGQWFPIPGGGRCYLYTVEDLERLKEEMRGADKAYWDPQNPGYYRVPEGWVRQREAWRMFGVDKGTWKRWEREGQITCGTRVNRGGPKLYKVEDLNRLLEEYGRYAPPYADPQRPDCYRVPLSGYDLRRREVIIDGADLPIVEGRRWCWTGFSDRRRPGTGNVTRSEADDKRALHRIILGLTDPALHVMHLNDDPLDCRRANLIVRTLSEKLAASRKTTAVNGKPCTSRFKGVSWDRCRGKWVAQIKRDGKRHLGRFDDELAAAEAYDQAAWETWGRHARLNFPDGIDAALAHAA